jgi:hypothetical protein
MTVDGHVAILERQNRWMRRLTALAFAAIAAMVLMGQGKDAGEHLHVRELHIVDGEGRSRIRLMGYWEPVKGPALVVGDLVRGPSVVLSAGESGSSVTARADKAGPSAGVRTYAKDPPFAMVFAQSAEDLQAQLFASDVSGAIVSLSEPSERPADGMTDPHVRLALGLQGGDAVFKLTDTHDCERAVLGLSKEGLLRFGLADSDGNDRAMLRVEGDGTPSLELLDLGKPAISFRASTDGSRAVEVRPRGGDRGGVGLGVRADGSAYLDVRPRSADNRFLGISLAAACDGSSRLSVHGTGKEAAALSAWDGTAGVKLADKTGQERAVLGLSAEGTPRLDLGDK